MFLTECRARAPGAALETEIPMARRKPLQVWLYDQRVAELTTSGQGKIHCSYTKEAIERWDLNVPLLSCSLPLRERRYADAAAFFRGLLPDGAGARSDGFGSAGPQLRHLRHPRPLRP